MIRLFHFTCPRYVSDDMNIRCSSPLPLQKILEMEQNCNTNKIKQSCVSNVASPHIQRMLRTSSALSTPPSTQSVGCLVLFREFVNRRQPSHYEFISANISFGEQDEEEANHPSILPTYTVKLSRSVDKDRPSVYL